MLWSYTIPHSAPVTVIVAALTSVEECCGLAPSSTQHPSLKLFSSKSHATTSGAAQEREADSLPDSATAAAGPDLLSAVTQLLQQTQQVSFHLWCYSHVRVLYVTLYHVRQTNVES